MRLKLSVLTAICLSTTNCLAPFLTSTKPGQIPTTGGNLKADPSAAKDQQDCASATRLIDNAVADTLKLKAIAALNGGHIRFHSGLKLLRDPKIDADKLSTQSFVRANYQGRKVLPISGPGSELNPNEPVCYISGSISRIPPKNERIENISVPTETFFTTTQAGLTSDGVVFKGKSKDLNYSLVFYCGKPSKNLEAPDTTQMNTVADARKALGLANRDIDIFVAYPTDECLQDKKKQAEARAKGEVKPTFVIGPAYGTESTELGSNAAK